MEKDRSSKVLTIVALLIGVVGLSLGFAAFSRTLTIESSAEVRGNSDDFSVVFSTDSTKSVIGKVEPVASTGATAESATITGDKLRITGLKANFTSPGQKVEYRFYAYNEGELDAFLKSIVFENKAEGATKVCTAIGPNPASTTYVNLACDSILVSVSVGGEALVTGSKSGITNHELKAKTGEEVVVTIEYKKDGSNTDGDFKVEFGDIALNYNTTD